MSGWDVFLVVTAVIALATAVYSYVVMSNIDPTQSMTPDPRSDMVVTTVKEGSPVPICYGTVRVAGNLLYYGAVESEAQYVTVESGKDSTEQITGYKYYLNAWIGVCVNDQPGAIQFMRYFVNDDIEDIQASETHWSDGTDSTQDMSFLNIGGQPDQDEGQDFDIGEVWEVDEPPIKGRTLTITDEDDPSIWWCDDGTGKIFYQGTGAQAGTVNYATGEIVINSPWGDNGDYDVNVRYQVGSGTADSGVAFPDSYLKNIVWWAWRRWYVGENVQNMPNVQFLFKRTLPASPVANANMTQGINPAAVVYDLLTNKVYGGQVPTNLIDMDAFNAAANVWAGKGYGLNFVLKEQGDLGSIIETIMSWVGGHFYMTYQGKFALHAYDPLEAPSQAFTQDDFIDFTISRKSWNTTQNDIRVQYTDPGTGTGIDVTYVRKMFGLYDAANVRVQGQVVQKEIVLDCFTDYTAVCRRAWELLKLSSYPSLTISFTTTQQYPTLHIGSVIAISHSDYGMNNVTFRITGIENPQQDDLQVKYTAEQMVEQIFDANFNKPTTGDNTSWVPVDWSPLPAPYTKVFELPANPITGRETAYLFLASRAGIEEGAQILTSLNPGAGFQFLFNMTYWSQYGVLNAPYSTDTYSIDDEIGLQYTPYRNSPDPQDLSRAGLFSEKRYALIDDEIIAFQTQQAIPGTTSFKLLGVIRGSLGTPIQSHAAGAPIWIFVPQLDKNIKKVNYSSTFYVKFYPFQKGKFTTGVIPVITVSPTLKAIAPSDIEYMEAIRNGAMVTVTWNNDMTIGFDGAGSKAENILNDIGTPFYSEGTYEYCINWGAIDEVINNVVVLNSAPGFTFSVREKHGSYYGPWASLWIDTSNGRYIMGIGGPVNY